ARQLRDDEIVVAVVVEITGVHAHARLRFAFGAQGGARQQGGVLERAVSLVDPELVRQTVVRDVDVDPAVAVEVCGGYSKRGPELARDARGSRDVRKSAVAVVSVQV